MCIRAAKFPSFIKGTDLAQVPLRAEVAEALCREFTILECEPRQQQQGEKGSEEGRKERKHVLLSLSQSSWREPGAQVYGALCWKMKQNMGKQGKKQRSREQNIENHYFHLLLQP